MHRMQNILHGTDGCHDFVTSNLFDVFDQTLHEDFEMVEAKRDLIPLGIQPSFAAMLTRSHARESVLCAAVGITVFG